MCVCVCCVFRMTWFLFHLTSHLSARWRRRQQLWRHAVHRNRSSKSRIGSLHMGQEPPPRKLRLAWYAFSVCVLMCSCMSPVYVACVCVACMCVWCVCVSMHLLILNSLHDRQHALRVVQQSAAFSDDYTGAAVRHDLPGPRRTRVAAVQAADVRKFYTPHAHTHVHTTLTTHSRCV